MDKELSILDIIKPIWLKKIEMIIVLILVSTFMFCSVYLSKQILNTVPKLLHHQDLEFNDRLEQKYITNFINDVTIKNAYEENNLIFSDEYFFISLVNSSSRYNAMKSIILDETEELLIKLNSLETNSDIEQNLWDEYLNLDSKYHQIVLHDESLTEIEAKKVITSIINNFNNLQKENNILSLDIIKRISFDPQSNNLLYLNNRLQEVTDIIRDYKIQLETLELDVSELKYKINVLMSHIYNIDPLPFEQNLKKLQHQIKQNKLLKENLFKLHDKFFGDENSSNFQSTESQLTVDSITQLIDLGSDISELRNKEKLTDAIYQIDLKINELEGEIFELNSVQSVFLLNYDPLNTDEISYEVGNTINFINENINVLRQLMNEQAVYTKGNNFIKYDYKVSYNVNLFSFLLTSIFMMFYITSIYIRYYYKNLLK